MTAKTTLCAAEKIDQENAAGGQEMNLTPFPES
jgi:hypothetical protein